ncbi:MAG: proton-conducting transporter membrane subunit [Anaerolineales bacterium]
MSAPILWIVLPIAVSGGLILLARWRRISVLIGSTLATTLAFAAWLLPVGKSIPVGILVLELQPSLTLFGRRFLVENSDRPLIVVINLTLAFWFIGSASTQVRSLFIPLGLTIGAVLTAAVLVQPLYYGAILLLLAAMLSIVLFVSEGRQVNLGIKRYWVFQSVAMPLLLLGGWLVSGTEAIPADLSEASFIYFLFLIAFSLLLSAIPFQSWLPAVSQEVNPYAFSFAFFSTSFSTLLFVIALLGQYPWLFSSSWMVVFFSFQGFLMSLLGGVGAGYSRHLGKWMGYALIKEMGVCFLILGLGMGSSQSNTFLTILYMQVLPRGVALALLAYTLNIFRLNGGSLGLQDLAGIGRHYPFATIAFFVATLTLVGFPLTASFPIHLLVWQGWFQQYPPIAFSAIMGSIGVLIGGLRAMAVLVRGESMQSWTSNESRQQIVLLMASAIILLLFGVFPQWFLSLLFDLGMTYLQGG